MARVILAPEEIATIGSNQPTTINGYANSEEQITLVEGVTVQFDGSFNAGGDTIVLPGAADEYTARLDGSLAVFEGLDIVASIPVGIAGITITFADGSQELIISQQLGAVLIGDIQLTDTPVELDFSQAAAALRANFISEPPNFDDGMKFDGGKVIDLASAHFA